MKSKHSLFLGQSETGIFAQALFGSSGAFEKVAGAPAFSDWETGESLRNFISKIKTAERKDNIYVLVNALGAGEFFGSNINSDWFGWDALSHEGDDYGYQTFRNGHAFQHHANKDPTRAFGVPELSVLNHGMKRVELVIRLSREQARLFGADSIIRRIENGEFPDVSMGCKVPFDVCSICEHHSKTRNDYCEHMRPPPEKRDVWGPNKILADGRKIFVKNTRPRFFDISFVFIGADKTAKVMAKLASKGAHVCLGSVCALPAADGDAGPELYGPSGDALDLREFHKAASACDERTGPCGRRCAECSDRDSCENDKLAYAFRVKSAEKKLAEIVKRVPVSHFSLKRLPKLESSEPDISHADLDRLSERPLCSALGGSARMGIVLKPHEFQHVVLRRMGEDDLLHKLDRDHKVFRQVPDFDFGGLKDVADPLDHVFSVLKKYIKQRTALGTPFVVRVMMMSPESKNALPTRAPIGHSLLDKVSAAYNGYRREVLKKVSQVVETVRSDPKLRAEILGDDVAMMFKTATSEILPFDSMQYLLGAHLQSRDLLCSNMAASAAVQDHEELFQEYLATA